MRLHGASEDYELVPEDKTLLAALSIEESSETMIGYVASESSGATVQIQPGQ